jgi:hypothetical protein
MIAELEVIEKECLPDSMRQNDKGNSPNEKLDAFVATRRDLGLMMKELEDGIKERDAVFEEFGRCAKVVELKSANDRMLERVKEKHKELTTIYEKEASKRKSKYTPEDLDSMKNIVSLFGEEITDLENDHNKRKKEVKEDFARKLRDQRKAEREKLMQEAKAAGKELDPVKAEPLSAQTMAFLEKKAEHDIKFQEKEEEMYQGVVRLRGIAEGINTEIQAQEVMLNDIEKQMDKVDQKFKVSNKMLKKFVKESGGGTRWCVLIFLFLVFLALVGYMFNFF